MDYATMSEEELTLKVFQRDKNAIGELFTRNRPRLFAIALRDLQGDALAADVVQDVFYNILKNGLSSFDVNKSLAAYLTTCVRNKTLDYVKSMSRRDKLYARYERMKEAGGLDHLEQLREEDINEEVDRILANLPKEARQVLTLSLKHELDAREIAELLNKPESTIRTSMRDGKQKVGPKVLRWLKFNVWYWTLLFSLGTHYYLKDQVAPLNRLKFHINVCNCIR